VRIWIATITEPLPCDGDDVRLHRVGTLARALVERGHNVLWWASTFDHFTRAQRFTTDTSVKSGSRLVLKLIRSPGYRSNVSASRLADHAYSAFRFVRLARHEDRPDVILACLPTLEMAAASCWIGGRLKVPVVVDVRDLYPDVFVEVFPKWMRPFVRAGMWPY
jgi:hypothetical protein